MPVAAPCLRWPWAYSSLGEHLHIILCDLLFHQPQQLHGAAVLPGAVVDLLRAAPHAPPVVDGAAVGAVPGAVEHRADDLDEERVPPPFRQADGLQDAVRQTAAEAVVPVGALRLPVIPGIEDFNVFPVREIQRMGRVRQAGPAEDHSALWPDAPEPPAQRH